MTRSFLHIHKYIDKADNIMKQTWRNTADAGMKRPLSALLAAMLLCTGAASSGCSLGGLSQWAGQFREEYAPTPSSGETGLVEGPPPPIVRPGEGKKDEETAEETAAETEAAETEPPETEADPVEDLPAGARPLTLKNAAAANVISLLVARYGCVLTEEETVNGWRKGYHYEIDSPGGRASVEFCDMRGTPSGCFGTMLTADGVTLAASAQDFDNPAAPVTLSESAASFTAFDNPFAPYLDGHMQIGEEGDGGTRQVHCETKDGTRRADFTLDADTYEIRSMTEYSDDGAARTVTYTSGAERFGADRLTAALTDYYSLSPEDLTFTLEDVRRANTLSALLPAFGSAGYVLKREENGRAVTERVSAYESGGAQIVVYTDTGANGITERRYLRDGISYPDAEGYAYRSADLSPSVDNIISAYVPDGQIGSVTVSGSSVLFTVRTTVDGVPVLVRLIADRNTLLLDSCEADTVGADSHPVYSLTVSRGGEKTDEGVFSSLGDDRTVTYHIDWDNAPREDLSFSVPAGWAFRLSFLSDASCWYDAEHTQAAPRSYQAAADGENREIWVTGAVKYVTSNDGTGLPGSAPNGVTAAGIASANLVSALVARYGSVTETFGGETLAFRKDGSLWVLYKNDGAESAEVGPVRMKAEDGWTSYTASYGDVVRNPDAAYSHDDAFSAVLTESLNGGTLRELIPQGGGTGDREFIVASDARRYIRFTLDRSTLAVRLWQSVSDGTVTAERRFFYGVFAGEDFLIPWDLTRTAAFHVLDAGNEIALIRIRIPRGGPLRLEMPDGWNWFFLDKALTEAAPSWIQVTAGEEDAELWVDNRDPETRAAEPSEPPRTEEPGENGE